MADLLTNTVINFYPESAKRIYVPYRARLVKSSGNNAWIEEKRILFKNYVFVESDQIEAFSTHLHEPGFETSYFLLGKGSSRLRKRSTQSGNMNTTNFKIPGGDDCTIYPVSDADMARLRTLMGENDYVEISRGIKENGIVRFVSGPLVGMEGKIIRMNIHKRYATVQMPFMGELRNVDVGIEVLNETAVGDAS